VFPSSHNPRSSKNKMTYNPTDAIVKTQKKKWGKAIKSGP